MIGHLFATPSTWLTRCAGYREPTPIHRRLRQVLLLAAACLASLSGCTSVGSAPRSCFHRDEAAETEIGYCQAIRTGGELYVSGTAGRGEMASAVRSVYERLKLTLEANGLTFADVVKENVYATDLDAFIENKAIRKEFYHQSAPAATWVQVQRLYVPALVVEIELTARYPK
jgi:2-iminobutanoate/2-iminopropanoate deaminase